MGSHEAISNWSDSVFGYSRGYSDCFKQLIDLKQHKTKSSPFQLYFGYYQIGYTRLKSISFIALIEDFYGRMTRIMEFMVRE
jgi:hypothetical protein